MKINNAIACTCLLFSFAITARAATFDWRDTNSDVLRSSDSFSLTVDGVTAIAQAYVGEWNSTTNAYDILGPYATSGGYSTHNADGFLQAGQGLMLEAETSNFTESCSTGECGFDNRNRNGLSKFNFAVFQFDQAVDLQTSMNTSLSNYDHDFWLASGASAPDLGLDFMSALSGFTKTVHDPTATFQGATGLETTHKNLTYLAIGAPLDPELGSFPGLENPDGGYDTFGITSFTVAPTAVPIPAAVWLFGSGLVGLLGLARGGSS